ncbi:exonuclease domain-containing protein [Bariatricus massiliensis]|uniref:3'-5' exonuclease n=1 Tax=Bariatricus massiliensis TaxID=1745713 RepID=A0ABS8DCB3_9FIRM|nr:exonuclease domain-containing protein [Bariatricus massiliensis]MCB7303251.1 3'-5' exonuclease [Bariatricus massiliensis]MCB7373383.1 3'-5' exonuclease [Bariatricus massiliensis]MCB7386053.1 3'-5' exonuclease [Bariatricus massiliensis]MCB7410215.1 3'-5' exonuclease [Bariatricus massiliensis]MCQ5252501.1 exonuclease domain-containing protein [Bariatricus massiliensis]
MLKSYIAFDVETTGLSPAENEIIEIGALKVRDGRVTERFMEFIKPKSPIPPAITNLTGICDESVASAGNIEQVLPEFLEFCQDDVLIGHNILFDYSFVKVSAQTLGKPFDKQGIDTLKIAKVIHKDLPSRSLGDLCDHYQITNSAAHRAYHDALATAKLYQTMAHYYEEQMPEVFLPTALICRIPKSAPATPKQLALLERLYRQRGLTPSWSKASLTKSAASQMIDALLSGGNSI